ncbi:ABC transporter transmembrane domain-containing protein [Poriferisphaera sp. WC338]|uniref:ABC transporter transmembrane domain-containing protein n=1 Tax=Poriferisphaera sp. WC338 TaxID=3425129 RepID=UPI003D814999
MKTPSMDKSKAVSSKRTVRRDDLAGSIYGLGSLMRPNMKQIAVVLLLLMVLTGVNMTPPLLLWVLIEKVFDEKIIWFLYLVIAGYLGCFATRNLLYFYSKFTAVNIGEHVAFRLRKQLFEQLQRKSLGFYRKNSPGQVSSRVMHDSFVVQSFIQDELPTLLQSLLLFIGLIAIMFAMNWSLALVATAVLPLHVIAAIWFKQPIKDASSEAQEHLAGAQSNLIEKLLAAEVVKGYTAEQRENQAFTEAIDSSRQSQIRSKKFHVRQKVVGDMLVGLGTILFIGYGAFQVMRDTMDAGAFLSFFVYTGMLYPNVMELMSGFAKLTKVSASVDRVFEILNTDETEIRADSPVIKPIRGDVTYKNVAISYDEREPLIKGINIDIPSGQICAFTGSSGTGKSSLAKLLLRFNTASEGMLMVDGVDVQDYDLQHLRESISMAFQDCLLFESTIIENLRYAKPGACMAKIVDIAKRTGAHDVIRTLPDGYDTDLGGGEGVSLSRGQMQRIALARAILRDPRILILDEATSSIDPDSELQIIPEVLEAMKGRTVIMITSNRELLKHADMVVELTDDAVNVFDKAQHAERMAQGIAGRIGKNIKTISGWLMPLLIASMLCLSTSAYAQDKKVAPVKPAAAVKEEAKPKEEKKVAEPAAKPAPAKKEAAKPKAVAKPAPAKKETVKPASKPQPKKAAPAPAAKPKPVAKPAVKPKLATPIDSSQLKLNQGVGDFIPLAGLNQLELDEILDIALGNAKSEQGYVVASNWLANTLPSPPQGLNDDIVLSREEPGGVYLLHVGYKTYRSQPPHLYLYAQTMGGTKTTAKAELDLFNKQLQDARKQLDAQSKALTVQDLSSELITLSYIEADRCLAVLKSLGYQCIEFKKGGAMVGKTNSITPSGSIDPKKLPAVVLMPGPDSIDLVGNKMKYDLSRAADLPNHTNAARAMELMVLYHPSKPGQFSEVLDRIRNTIDLPARQIYIEAMILEISEIGLEKLGVKWELSNPIDGGELSRIQDVILGRLPKFNANNDEDALLDLTVEHFDSEWKMQVQALVRDGNAEILSRPSVLTLNARQASIRVGEEIPIATSAEGLTSGNKLSFNFKYQPVGILLNVRPRISADNEEVSMQIDGLVSDQVPGRDLVIQNSSGEELARAPRISTRRVQTHTRIANNTPFIIGGLVSKERTEQIDKVPLLGDIPFVGGLFRSTSKDSQRREVIIVITPYVLPDNRVVGRNLPKDEDAFDSFDHQLFRDAYRIRAEDVFDLGFLLKNEKLLEYKRLANLAVDRDFRLAASYPFDRFVGPRFPGEPILVYRQMYEVVKRLKLDASINHEKIIFFEADDEAIEGFDVSFLWDYASKFGDDVYAEHSDKPKGKDLVYDALKGRVIAITYTLQPNGEVSDILEQPVPDIRILDCPDRKAWSKLLWELNQPNEEGKQQYTILIQNEKDFTRLKRAILLKQVVRLNGGNDKLTLSKFAIGRQLLMPDVKQDKVYLIDEETAKYFFLTDQYYPALKGELVRDLRALRAALQVPNISRYIDVTLPPTTQSIPLIDLPQNFEQ